MMIKPECSPHHAKYPSITFAVVLSSLLLFFHLFALPRL